MNEKNITLQKINSLNELYLDSLSEQVLLDMETILINYLHHYPNDSEMWLKLVMIEFTSPLEDYERIESYIESMLKYDKNNVCGLLVFAYAQYIFRGEISNELFVRIKNVCGGVADGRILSMIYLAKAWYYKSKDQKVYEQLLLKSIEYCGEYVRNYVLLGELYLKIGKNVEGKNMIHLAIKNVQKIYSDDDFMDVTDINSFFDEFFKGIYITPENLRSIQKLIE